MKRFYTAESVTEGHPDKLCDLIADSVLDDCLKGDSDSRVLRGIYGTAISLCQMKQGRRDRKCRISSWKIWKDGVKNMKKYEKMIERNRKESKEKVLRALAAINQLVMEQERVSVPKLVRITGLSRGFFYKNPKVRNELDHAMEKQISLLEQQVTSLKVENGLLKMENQKL